MKEILIINYINEYEKIKSLEIKANLLDEVRVLSMKISSRLSDIYNKEREKVLKENYDGIFIHYIHETNRHCGTLLYYITELRKRENNLAVKSAEIVLKDVLLNARTAAVLVDLFEKS